MRIHPIVCLWMHFISCTKTIDKRGSCPWKAELQMGAAFEKYRFSLSPPPLLQFTRIQPHATLSILFIMHHPSFPLKVSSIHASVFHPLIRTPFWHRLIITCQYTINMKDARSAREKIVSGLTHLHRLSNHIRFYRTSEEYTNKQNRHIFTRYRCFIVHQIDQVR